MQFWFELFGVNTERWLSTFVRINNSSCRQVYPKVTTAVGRVVVTCMEFNVKSCNHFLQPLTTIQQRAQQEPATAVLQKRLHIQRIKLTSSSGHGKLVAGAKPLKKSAKLNCNHPTDLVRCERALESI